MTVELLLAYSVILSLVISVIYRVLTNPKEVRRIKEEAKFYNQKVKKAQKAGNKEEVNRYTGEMMKASQKQMKITMKPMLASMVLFLFILGGFHTTFAELLIPLPFSLPLPTWEMAGFPFVYLTAELNWFWWYVIITLPCTLAFRKALGVE